MMSYIIISFICALLLAIYLKYFATSRTVCKCSARMAGKVVVITGGNSGIGKCTATDLARRGAKVYIASEVSVTDGEAAAKQIQLESGNPSVYFRKLDLASMKSVKEFAKAILEQEAQIHVLINNAGVYLYRKYSTEDGFDATMAINYVGHYLLTLLLLERLKNSAPSRIIVITSLTHRFNYLDFNNMMSNKPYFIILPVKGMWSYSRSKLAVLMFARELGRKLEGSEVTVCAVDPGMVDTAIITSTFPILAKVILYVVKKMIFVSPNQGAQTSIHCAVSQEVEGANGYYNDCRKANPSAHALDNAQCTKLWEYSFNLVKSHLEEASDTL